MVVDVADEMKASNGFKELERVDCCLTLLVTQCEE
jgi:hypothetical protein